MALKEVLLEDKSIYMVFDYAEHDFLVSEILGFLCSRLHTRILASDPSPFAKPAGPDTPRSTQVSYLSVVKWRSLPALLPHSAS